MKQSARALRAKGSQKAAPAAPPEAKAGGLAGLGVNRATFLLATALLVATAVYLKLHIMIGIWGEWYTAYHEQSTPAADVLFFAGVMVAFLAAAYWCDRKWDRLNAALRALVAACMTAGFGVVLFTATTTGPLGRPEFVAPAFMSGACGLFERESHKVTDARKYLSDFPETLKEYGTRYMETVRVNNNPPGTTMVFYGGSKLALKYPAIKDAAVDTIFGKDFPIRTERYLRPIVGSWILIFGAALAFLPAFLCASRLCGGAAFFPAAIAMLAVSMLLFAPDNDTLQVTFFLWMVYFYLRARDGKAPLWGALFGFAAAGAFFFTLATAVVVIVIMAWALSRHIVLRKPWRGDLVFWGASAAGLGAGFAALYLATGYDSLSSLYMCYVNHKGFYVHFPRTYWKWAPYNIWNFAMFFGGALTAAVAWYAARRPAGEALSEESRETRGYLIAGLIVLAVLDLTGKNLSEVNRLWVFFMPLLALPALALARREKGGFANLWALGLIQVVNVLLMRVFVDVWQTEALFKDVEKYIGK